MAPAKGAKDAAAKPSPKKPHFRAIEDTIEAKARAAVAASSGASSVAAAPLPVASLKHPVHRDQAFISGASNLSRRARARAMLPRPRTRNATRSQATFGAGR